MINPLVDEISGHLKGLAALAEQVAAEMTGEMAQVAELVLQTLATGNTLFFCGNGGSAADAQHLATEYVVRFRDDRRAFPAIALTTDTSLLTAAANDLGFEQVFARQIHALGNEGDLLFLHSTSGDSANLLSAARAAREKRMRTVAMLARGGGPLRELVDVAVVLPTDVGAHAQEVQMALGHAVCAIVEARADRLHEFRRRGD